MQEVYVSVDIEAAGPSPGVYSMLSIGACVVANTSKNFYRELKPVNSTYIAEALKRCSFSEQVSRRIVEFGEDYPRSVMKALTELGADPKNAMQDFSDWIIEVAASDFPVFVGFNAPFDWMFVCDYFWRFIGRNSFGHNALDIKSYYMGMAGCEWRRTGKRGIPAEFHSNRRHTHYALDDAIEQAEMFEKLIKARVRLRYK